ncbi:MAG: murein hydrolase activator EnvC family protein [Bacillota bacterium]|uniref:murein hydrolase activator EnvC family protein n=1 Tax=Fictibacillus TaxID=1329200 RepID=UPI0018CCEA9C|nr:MULTISPECIES: M23 family metallopeptidase [unclassified Fictibacillus]MBH0157167.1 peptidoglycan DD-metalloendopeptidase family protein [Fictibacillus sp. 5RED26]MBH0159488.1 peptidoglycan DD-metalloendopeptidase family protein [Fictibacillus sp. 26RED30]MBH0163713.1 peptidoglycan DD-metalloendopeptidase family protein [Fictibacillus sp. 7GRE50]MBH0169661.1 peptidoglycan DD-metalloendopeptidase family protein [Fictibacillus sp. 18YEL24]MBH0174161.1 peptidoglycan DD-metalloendopeptidase fami
MKKELVLMTAFFTLQLGIANELTTVNATTLDEIKEKKEENDKKRQGKLAEKNEIVTKKETISSEIKRLDLSIMDKTRELESKKEEIEEITKNIETLKKEIAIIEKRIEKRDKLLKERVSAMYEDGGATSYLEVVLGSKSFGDFLDRVIALNTIADQDRSIIEEHKADLNVLDIKKAKIENQLLTLEETKVELEKLMKVLDDQRNKKNIILSDLKNKEGEINSYILDLEEKNKLLDDQEKAKKAEIARAKRESAMSQNNNSQPKSNSGSGSFLFPTEGIITSKTGPRWGKEHAGLDIAKAGTVPVVAAANGTVLRSYYSSSYGNVVYLTHYINGQLYTTVYAHMKSRLVDSGETVTKGQQLGYQGNTGRSTGQHLHFELHQGEWNSSKSNAIDALPLLSR